MMKYQWAAFAGLKVDAQIIGEHIEYLRETSGGSLQPADLVADASNKKSVLHSLFEWDDAVAATERRIDQARYILRKIHVVIESSPETPPTRAFVSVIKDDNPIYTSIQTALTDDDLHKQLVAKAYKEALDWMQRYRDLVEFAAVFRALEAVVA